MTIFADVTNFDVGGHQPNIKLDNLNIILLRMGNALNLVNKIENKKLDFIISLAQFI
jgi:hypothetical protein